MDGIIIKGFGYPKFDVNISKLVFGFKIKT
jgi:hypothetical protein